MNGKRSGTPDDFSDMGIPLAGEPTDGDGGSGEGMDDWTDDGEAGLHPLDFEGVVGEVTDGLCPIGHSAYETPGGTGLCLLVENTGTRAFERVEARVRLDDGGTAGEFVATSGTGLDRLDPGDRWRLWIPLESRVSDTTIGYTVDLEAT